MISIFKIYIKGIGIKSILFILIIWSCNILLSMEIVPAYAEKKKLTGTSRLVKILAGSTISESGKTPVNLVSRLYVLSSIDPAWNNANLYSVTMTIDPVMEGGEDFSSHSAIILPGGDHIFLESKGAWHPKIEGEFNLVFEVEGFIQGGTGKLEGIKGLWKHKGKGSSGTNVIGEWEIVYFKSDF
jgi:hypothetical protein